MGVKVIVLALDSKVACTGKTTTLRALTSALIAANKTVFIADATMIENGTDDDLGEWALKLPGEPDEPQLLDYRHIKSPEALEETLRLKRRFGNSEFLIIDTNNKRHKLANAVRKCADLTLVPTIQRSSDDASVPTLPQADNFQLSYQAISKNTGPSPLRSMLPASEIFADQHLGGHIPDMLRVFSERTRETTKTPSRHKVSFKRRQAAMAAWSSAQSLAWEIEWLARGYSLAKVDAPVDRFHHASKS
jgi:hypothetical protein